MRKGFFTRIFICISFFGYCLYSYIDMQNEITELRIRIPKLTTEVRRIEEENMRLLYELEIFESPENLMKLAKDCEFAHLKYPFHQDVLSLRVDDPTKELCDRGPDRIRMKPSITFATGGNP